jgi:ketosteroid isomerase-like protein
MTRTPQEIWQHHAGALMAGDVDELLHDYVEDAVLITGQGALQGKAGVRQFFEEAFRQLPDAEFDVPTQIFHGDVLFMTWSATSRKSRVTSGADTFVFSGDGIRVHTVHAVFEPMH